MDNLKPDQVEYLELLRNAIIYLPRELVEQHLITTVEGGFILSNALEKSVSHTDYLSRLGLALVDKLEEEMING